MANLCGMHDIESVAIAPDDTWILDTIAISENPVPKTYPTNLHVITRVNYGYGRTGTLPEHYLYNQFAQAVAMYVAGSRNCKRWIIGNETNLKREAPNGIWIYPWYYAACYKLCRNAIHALPGHEQDTVLVAGSGPWNAELKYDGNDNGDWITYFTDVLNLVGQACDGFALHAYTHSYDQALVTSTARMDAPFQNRYYEFRTYQDYMLAIPEQLRHLPAYLTESNGDGPWQATGLMPAMLQEIDTWNRSGEQPIRSVVFYRYPHYDQYYIEGRDDVLNEYYAAVAMGYESPAGEAGGGNPPGAPMPEPEPEPIPVPDRDIDPALAMRGVTFDFVSPPAGTGYWRIVKAEHLPDPAATVGPDHHILGTIKQNGTQVADKPFTVTWPDGDTTIYSKPDDPNASYNYDYGMSASLNEFSIEVADGNPSDWAGGIGMGAYGNPAEHTSTWIDFVWTIAEDEPEPTPPHTEYVLPLIGANLRAAPVDGLVLATLPYREAVTVVNETATQSDSYTWHGVNYQSHAVYPERSVRGFIRSDLLSIQQPEPEPEPPQPPDGILVHPLPGAVITQHFYQEPHYYSQFGFIGHEGTDLGGKPAGTPVLCMADGVVVESRFDPPGYGNFVELYHPDLLAQTLYAHLSAAHVQVGQRIRRGEVLGLLGSTGNSTGPHLHLSVRKMLGMGQPAILSPMPGGRMDPETWAALHGLKL